MGDPLRLQVSSCRLRRFAPPKPEIFILYEQLFSSPPSSDHIKICESRIDQLLKSINICLADMSNFRKNVLEPCQDAAAVETSTVAEKAEAMEFISNVATTRLLAEDYI